MLNEKRYLLIANLEEENKKFNFEGIRIISNPEEIEHTWHCNKTPLILRKDIDDSIINNYPILEVPEFIFGPEDFIIFCHKNDFESGEYITGQKFDTFKDRCFLCEMANRMGIKGPLYLYNQMTKRDSDVIIYDSENFFVKIELGCMKKGMLMINPKKHVLSAANIPNEHMGEYFQVMKDIEFLLKSIYGDEPVIFFEHGSAPSGISSHQRSIVHAHTHVAWGVPFEQKYLDMVCLKPSTDIRNHKDTKYFSYQNGTEGQLLVVDDPEVYVQRQYPRQVIGKMLGIDNELTNWRREPFSQNMTETFHDFYRFLKKNSEFLSERIRIATDGFVKGYSLRKNVDL